MKDFKKLDMWKQGMDIIDAVHDLYDGLPWQNVAEYRSQSMRAAISIASNIAEGSSRRSEKEKYRFMEFAIGSAFELETQTLSAKRRTWCSTSKADQVLQLVERQQKMLSGFMAVLKG